MNVWYNKNGGKMKMLVTDFDRTLFPDHFEENIISINDFVDQGNILVIATGRNLKSLYDQIKEYNIKYNYLICNDGAVIYDQNLNSIFQVEIEPKLAEKIVCELKKDKNIKEVFVSDGYNLLENVSQVTAIFGKHIKKYLAFKTLKKIVNKFDNVHGYVSTNWVAINDKKASKGMAVKYLVSKYNLAKEDVFTIGNSFNDISMNEMYQGYSVKKANYALKRVSIGKVKSVSELIKIINQK